jgi:putative phage-type endonuclease
MSALAIRQGTDAWLEARRSTIGSSDVAVIAGESPHKSAYTLAAEKLGLIPEVIDADTQELMAIGTLMQPVLLSLYERKTGRHPKAAPTWRQHRELEWATASLDGTAPVRRVVEAKWTHARRWRSGERIPGDVACQVQWQLFVTGWDVADVVVLDHAEARVEAVERDDALIDDLVFLAGEFRGYLSRGELPPIDGSESSRRSLAARHPRDNGMWLAATSELAELTTQLAESRAAKRTAEDAERTVGNALRAVIGDASGIDGLVSLKRNADSTRTNWPAVAAAYRELLLEVMPEEEREHLDTLQSIQTETSEGARVLRLLSKGNQS